MLREPKLLPPCRDLLGDLREEPAVLRSNEVTP
jgi:hypothetical protein